MSWNGWQLYALMSRRRGAVVSLYYGYYGNVSMGKRKKILKQLGLWDRKARPPPKATGPPKVQEYNIDYSVCQVSESTRPLSGGSVKWLYVDPEYPEVYPPVEGHIA